MRRVFVTLCAIAAIATFWTAHAFAEPAQDAIDASAPSVDGVHVSHRAITLKDGRKLSYTARAGFIPLVNDDTGEITAHVYFVAYTADQADSARPRPITFAFPGGPGATETLSRSGPLKVVEENGRGKVVDNPDTLLSATDLVLVDPVGTGYSRAAKPEFTPMFYGVIPDRDSLVEFMRIYLKRYDPAQSPIFLTGGSYGSVRSVLVAEGAMSRGIPIRGIMISAEVVSQSLNGSDQMFAINIPGFTVVAQAHNKLPQDLQADRARAIEEAKSWTNTVYLPALARGSDLSVDDRHKVAIEMARLTGLKADFIEAHNLRVGREEFANELLRDDGKSIGFYDTRIAGPLQMGTYDPTHDPSLMAFGSAYPTLGERDLLNRELGMASDALYVGPFGGTWPLHARHEDWMTEKWFPGSMSDEEPVGYGIDRLLPTLLREVDRGVPVLIGEGYYDWACPPFGADYVATRVRPEQKGMVTVVHYESGHGVPVVQLDADASAFIEKVMKGPAPKTRREMVQ